MQLFQITLDTCFKQFVEAKGIRLVDVKHGTALYQKLVKEFNDLKQAFIDIEEEEEQLRAKALMMEESGEAPHPTDTRATDRCRSCNSHKPRWPFQ